MWEPKELKIDSRMDYVWYAVNENEPVKYGSFICKQDAVDMCVKLNNKIQTETPEEKEALDRIDTTNAQFESLAVEVNSEPAWNGEGLPPVGVECEIKYKHSCNAHWRRCKVFAYEKSIAAIFHDEDLLNHATIDYEKYEFRPIETPEQKAAMGRLADIKEMASIIEMRHGYAGTAYEKYCATLYDKGYRKPE